MKKELRYSEVKAMADAVEDYILHLGSDMDEALRMAFENVDGITVRPDCNFTECDHGMGLAGGSGCPGDPCDANCKEFTQEYSKQAE